MKNESPFVDVGGDTLNNVRKRVDALRCWIDRERSGRYGKLKRLDVLNSIDEQLRQITAGACSDDGAALAAMPANGSFDPNREWSWSVNDHDYEGVLESKALTTPLRPPHEEYKGWIEAEGTALRGAAVERIEDLMVVCTKLDHMFTRVKEGGEGGDLPFLHRSERVLSQVHNWLEER